MPNTTLMVASSDEHFREMVRDSLLNIPEAKIVAEYQEVAANLYIRVLQDLERHPHAGLIVDLSGDPDGAIKAIEKVKQAAPDLFVIASNFHADGDTRHRLHARRGQRISAAAAQAHRVPRRHGAPGPRAPPDRPGRKQARQDLHLPRHPRRRGHHHPGREFRVRAGAAQALQRDPRPGLDRQRRRHATGRVAAIHPHRSGRKPGAHGPGPVRRLRHPRSPGLLHGRPARRAGGPHGTSANTSSASSPPSWWRSTMLSSSTPAAPSPTKW